jgi:hypothetical protein
MLMKLWLYQGRHGELQLFSFSGGFEKARAIQDEDNGCTEEEAVANDLDVYGSKEGGYFSIDDGGSITLLEVEPSAEETKDLMTALSLAYDQGFRSGKSKAMRHMSDEPGLSLEIKNPYLEVEHV